MYMKKLMILFIFLPIAATAADDCANIKNVPNRVLTISDVVDLGLCRNPQTAAAYASLRAAHFDKNAAYSAYLPSVNLNASAGRDYYNKNWDNWGYGASLSASYLLFDFGKRSSDMAATIATYRATGFDYDETVQNYVYGVIGAYYGLLNADADVKSATSARDVAQTAHDTAKKKYSAGAVARADVLKAETTLASRDLDLERAKNNREIAKGKLLTQLSFPADQEITIADMESAATAYVCKVNNVEFVAIKAISDFAIDESTSTIEDSYKDQFDTYTRNTPIVVNNILDNYLEYAIKNHFEYKN